MTRINDFFKWVDNQISALSPEVKKLTQACDRVQDINVRVDAVLRNKQSNFVENAENAAALNDLKVELDVEAKLIQDNKGSPMAKFLKGFHNLFQPSSTSFDQYSES